MPVAINTEEDGVDLIVGARWTTPINKDWKFSLLGTVGGLRFESDFTVSGIIGLKKEKSEELS